MSTKAYALYTNSILILVLLSQVHCDWVEISQNRYTKEPHDVTGIFELSTKANRKYINQTLTERTWNRGVVDRVSYVGNIKRVPFATALKTRNGEKNIFNEHLGDRTDSSTEQYVFISVRPNVDTGDERRKKHNAITEGGIASADLFRDTRPSVNSKSRVQSSIANIFTRRKVFNDTIKVLDINKRDQISKSPLAEFSNNDQEIFNIDVSLNDNLNTAKNRQIQRNSNNVKLNRHQSVNVTKVNKSPKIKLFYRESNTDGSEGEFKDNMVKNNKEDITEQSYINYLDSIKYKSHRPHGRIESVNKFSHSTPTVYINRTEYSMKNLNKSEDNINVDQSTDVPFVNKSDEIILQTTLNKNEFSQSKDVPNVTNGNTRNGIWKLMKLVTDIIYKNTHRSFGSKIKYLERLKSSILTSIEDQIDKAWPDDALGTAAPRRTRSAQARGHLEFPSSESTLMTISFLTFAVFLIKLVLQVIHTYKNKTMMVAPTVVAAVGRAAAAFKNQYRQST